MGGIMKLVTGKEAKHQERLATQAAADQKAILVKQEKDLATKEEERLARQTRKRQGRRSLLFTEGTEAGVRADTLGG